MTPLPDFPSQGNTDHQGMDLGSTGREAPQSGMPLPSWATGYEDPAPAPPLTPAPAYTSDFPMSGFTFASAASAVQPEKPGWAEKLPQRTEDIQSRGIQMMQEETTRFQQISEQMQMLERAVARMEKQAVAAQEAQKQEAQQLQIRMAEMQKALDLVTAKQGAAAQQTATLQKSMETLTARNTDVMRQNMEFTSTSSKRWTKELEEYRSLFRDTVYDDLWKRLANIYIGILKHLKRKDSPELTENVVYCALEPLQEMMEEYGVTIQVTPVGEKRSFKRTRAKGKVLTWDPDKDATVARSIWPGFMRDSICLVPEIVESYVYQEGYQESAAEEKTLEMQEKSASEAEMTESGEAKAEKDSPMEAMEQVSVEETVPAQEKAASVEGKSEMDLSAEENLVPEGIQEEIIASEKGNSEETEVPENTSNKEEEK